MSGFFVAGIPIAKGSAKAFVNKKTGRAIVTQDNNTRQKPWASMISVTAQQLNQPIIDGPVRISLHFVMPRPKGHYGTGKNATVLKPSAPVWHTSKPDIDKTVRCVLDSLTGILWHDDCQVVLIQNVSKKYGDRPGVYIEVNKCW